MYNHYNRDLIKSNNPDPWLNNLNTNLISLSNSLDLTGFVCKIWWYAIESNVSMKFTIVYLFDCIKDSHFLFQYKGVCWILQFIGVKIFEKNVFQLSYKKHQMSGERKINVECL